MSAPGNDLLSEIENGGGLFTKLGVYLRSYLIPTVQQRGLPGQVYATPPDKPGDSSLQDLKTLVGQQNPVNSAYVGTNNSGQIVAAATPTSGITQITGDVNAGPGSGSQAATVVATHLTAPLPVNQGGSGTATPSLVAGSNVTISGSWPNQTVAAAASGMANPMTTVGDLIVGGTVTGGVAAPARLAAGTAGLVLTSNGPGVAPSYQPGGAGSSPLTKVASVSLGTVNSFTITGLDTVNNDYRISVRMKRSGTGAASDYIQIQFGDTSATPVWFTTAGFVYAAGALSTNLTSTSGITKVAQVQNNSASYMATEATLQFSADGLAVNGFFHSCFWENIVQFDEGPTPSVIGSLQFTTPNQSWDVSYSLYALSK